MVITDVIIRQYEYTPIEGRLSIGLLLTVVSQCSYHIDIMSFPSVPTKRGSLYLLSHPQMPNLLKIGVTRKHPIARATELSAGTGVPGEFVVEYWLGFENAFEVESAIHERLAEVRVDPAREFFRVGLSEAIAVVRSLSETYTSYGAEGGEWTTNGGAETVWNICSVSTPYADLFASFPDDGSDRELTLEERTHCRALRERLSRTEKHV